MAVIKKKKKNSQKSKGADAEVRQLQLQNTLLNMTACNFNDYCLALREWLPPCLSLLSL